MAYIPYVYDDKKISDVYSRLLEDRIIFIGSEIDSSMANSVIAQLLCLRSTSKDPIAIYINTPGGSVADGMAVYDTIQRVKREIDVRTACVGLAASMGSVLLCCGTKGKREILPHSQVMIHQACGQAGGKCDDVMVAAQQMKETQAMITDVLAKHTGMSAGKLKDKMKVDSWLSAEQAVKLGFCDTILD